MKAIICVGHTKATSQIGTTASEYLKNDIMNKVIQQELSEEFKEWFCKECKKQDRNGDGTLNTKDLRACLEKCGLETSAKELEFIVRRLDTNGDGVLSINELVENFDVIVFHNEDFIEIERAFMAIDLNNDGFIRLPELKKILCTSGRMSGLEAGRILNDIILFDTGDGKLDFPEFVRFSKSANYGKIKHIIEALKSEKR